MTDKWIANVVARHEAEAMVAKGRYYYPKWHDKWIGPPQQARSGGMIREELERYGYVGLYGFEMDDE
jgi:hypothetical protein